MNYILILCVHHSCHLHLCTCLSYVAINSTSRALESSLLRFAQGLALQFFIYINEKIFCFLPDFAGHCDIQGKLYTPFVLA